MKIVFYFYFIILLSEPIINGDSPGIIEVGQSPKVKMSDGHEIPIVGFGTWKIVRDRAFPLLAKLNHDSKVINAVVAAVKTGYRHIDTAYFYNHEPAIGKALKILFKEDVVKREDLFITTKVWCNYHSRSGAVVGLKNSVIDLGLDYVDLALIHFPQGCKDGDNPTPYYYSNLTFIPRTWNKEDYLETWKGMEDAKKKGLAKSIGVANFDTKQLKKIINIAKSKPVVSQVECNPYRQQKKMVKFCKDHKIIVTGYSPLRQGLNLLKDPVLTEIAKKKGMSVAQVAIKWNVQRGVVVIPKTTNPKRMAENLDVFKFELDEKDMKKIDKISLQPSINSPPIYRGHPDNPEDEN